MEDKDPIEKTKTKRIKERADNNTSTKNNQWSLKSYMLLAVLFFIIMSDAFLENVLVPICPSCMNARELTTTGAIASIICIIIFHAIISNHF